MGVAKLDENSRPTLTALASTGTGVIVPLYADPTTHRLLVDLPVTGNGINSINSDITANQTLTVGTSGSDFAIVDNASGDHKFNLPTASASVRGALSTTDWSTFNGKANANQTMYIGTTSVAINRASEALVLTGITSIDGSSASCTGNAATSTTAPTTAVLVDQTSGQTIGLTGSRLTKLWATNITCTNAITGSVTGNAGTATTASAVTNATLTTALTVNTGTVTLTGNVANTSALTIGAGAVSVSGSNTGDNSTNSTYTTLATTIATANTWSAAQTFTKNVQTVTPMGAQALDGTLGNIFTRTLGGDETFTQSGFSAGQCFMVEVTGVHTITWFSGITWITVGAAKPTQGAITVYGFRCTGTNTFIGMLMATQ